jgi:dGTPase
MELCWKKLLSDWRYALPDGKSGPSDSPSDYRSEFESDYDRIVYSPPFRRLARKTQVHPLAPNDHVHNRLTHSIEVASVGRSLGRRLAKKLRDDDKLPHENSDSDIAWILMSSCLAHDIGNPPFGHAGEFAIREWAASHQDDVFPDNLEISEGAKNDVLIFEGNAQSFRLTARSDNALAGHMRLTFATLASIVKYPWDSSDQRAIEQKKFNCFSSERDLFCEVFNHLGLANGNGTFARHPLSFLSEAADDICYRILDLEDAAEIGIVSAGKVREIYSEFLDGDRSDFDSMPLTRMRGRVIGQLIDESWRIFENDYVQIMNGSRTADLKSDFDLKFRDAFDKIKIVYQEIFADPFKVSTELGAYKALGRILKALCYATRELKTKPFDEMLFVSKRCLDLAWGKETVQDNKDKSYEWWLHQVLDFVSGLTDNYARQLSREIEGT